MNRKLVILAVLLALPVLTASASLFYSVSVPASVTIQAPQFTLYQSDCATPLSSVPFGSIVVGTSSSVTICLTNSGSLTQYLHTNSFNSTLSPTVGTLTETVTNKLGQSATLPLQVNQGDQYLVTFALLSPSTATGGTTNFKIWVNGYSA